VYFSAFLHRCIRDGHNVPDELERLKEYDFSGKVIRLDMYMIAIPSLVSAFDPLNVEMLCQGIKYISKVRGIIITSRFPGSVYRAIGQHLSQIQYIRFHTLFSNAVEMTDFISALSQMRQLEAVSMINSDYHVSPYTIRQIIDSFSGCASIELWTEIKTY
jgi:hypothetical protein